MSQSHHLAAIMFADIVGYTALMQKDEQTALEILNRFKELLEDITPKHEGRIVQYFGDGCLLAFDSSTSSVACAIALQKAFSEEPTVPVRIGLHLGDVIFRNENVFGDGVNIASRIESLGIPGSILMSKPIRDQIKNKSDFLLVSLGSFDFKNASEPMEVFALANPGFVVPKREEMHGKLKDIQKKSGILKWLSGMALIAVSIFALWYFIGQKKSSGSTREKSIAVLPFRNDSPEDSTQYFMDGVMDEILNNLQKIKTLNVISRTSVEQYRDTKKTIPEIAKEVRVNYMVLGSGQKFGDSIILRIQLVEIRNEREKHLMGSSFRLKLESAKTFFNIQSQVAQRIASELNAKITPQEKKLIEKLPTDNLEAYKAWLKGQFYLNKFNRKDLDSAMVYFEHAKQIDPNYTLAYTGISDVWTYRQQLGLVTPAEGNRRSMEAVMKAYALDSNNAVVQYTLAVKKVWGMFDWAGGEEGFKKSILLNPNSAITHAMYSHLLNTIGRPEEAFGQIDIALKLDPMNPFIRIFYGVDLSMVRKYDEAIKAFKDALNLSPGYPFAKESLVGAYIDAGRNEEAYGLMKSNWKDSQKVKSLDQVYLKDGLRGVQLSLAEELVELWTNNPNQYIAPTVIAMLYCDAEKTDKAIYWLEQAYNFRDPSLLYLLLPVYDNIRNDPRFQNLCQRMNLPYKPKL